MNQNPILDPEKLPKDFKWSDKNNAPFIEIVEYWQPIETAPRGERVIVYNPWAGSYTAEYEEGQWPLRYDGYEGIWYPVPTHWMPLPEPPVIPQSEQD